MAADHAALIDALAFPYRASAAYKSLMSRRADAAPATPKPQWTEWR